MDNSGGIQASLSGRYATALFQLARDGGSIETVESSLATVKRALAESGDLALLTSSPLIGRNDAARGIAAAAQVMNL
ncbi:F0F1 ATP synthase subunit delta, partial [Sphingomonas sp. ZT3P38]|uniref:F0F1 ATP synthase subunit delta n=1 Tax=Parasphingomonas zepuensis TaxID=3096161 RepID=UPI002FCA9A2B